jgi:hypothetical protein
VRDNCSRRQVLRTLAGAAVASLPSYGARSDKHGRIDVHHHMVPPLLDVWAARHWSPEVSLDAMDKYGTETAMLSVTGLPPAFADLFYDGSERARGLVRKVNEYGAKVVSDRPKRFGFFAALPLPGADATLKEIEYWQQVAGRSGIFSDFPGAQSTQGGGIHPSVRPQLLPQPSLRDSGHRARIRFRYHAGGNQSAV